MAEEKTLPNQKKEESNESDEEEEEETEEETVEVSKQELDKLKEERENYKRGLLSQKKKVKTLKKETETKETPEGDFVTKKEYQQSLEAQAIEAVSKDKVINDNWTEIVEYYSPRRGRNSIGAIKADIQDAKTLWENYKSSEGEGKDKKETAKAAQETAEPAGESKEGEPVKKKGERKILDKPTPVENWYKEEGEQ